MAVPPVIPAPRSAAGSGRRSPLAGAVLALCLVLAAGCSKGGADAAKAPGGPGGAGGPAGGPPQAMPVTVLAMQPQSAPGAIEVVAQTEGAKETEVRARVGGILEKRLYEEGQPVKAGQPLFQIDAAPFRIALEQARANLAQVRAQAEQAEREAKRLGALVEQQAISRREQEQAAASAAVSRANVQAAEAAVRQAELNLSWTTVTAPVAGVSGRALKSEGNLVATGDPQGLTTIAQVDPIWVRFSLSPSDAARLPGGGLDPKSVRGVELVLPDGSTYAHKGRLNFLATRIDPQLGTRQLRAEFPNPERALLPGQFVRARLLAGTRDNVFLVPQNAVMQSAEGHAVMTVGEGDKVEPRPVKVGQWQGSDWVILDGLKAGDRVVVDNLMKVRPGMPVKPMAPTSNQQPQTR